MPLFSKHTRVCDKYTLYKTFLSESCRITETYIFNEKHERPHFAVAWVHTEKAAAELTLEKQQIKVNNN